ncbi:MAG: flagellar biosynthetic protein FliO [Methylophilus sp.]|uniref:flagellar biosynthetic protein FliO n=1 Tax=Methylophilus sp. TaxID=29541 RepID=UPI002D19B93C|nr:flagellar biosynthetic protein FliO [Methylophilus sp.]HSH87807.1 flagellar biosynthetic protein FliO [Methylophilus sp.]
MKFVKLLPFCAASLYWPAIAFSAEAVKTAAPPSASDSLGRMVFGTVVVLLVIAVIAWVLRRVLPGQGLAQSGVIKQVGGVQLGPRERVVVLEVSGRWLVVGVGPGQMTALGEVAATPAAPVSESAHYDSTHGIDPQASFAVRLQQAMQHTVKSFKNRP